MMKVIDGAARCPALYERGVGLLLRRSGLPIQKVRGLNDESEPLSLRRQTLCAALCVAPSRPNVRYCIEK